MTQQERALYLAACGYRVFPIPPGQTIPRVKFSVESTTDAEKVKRFWRSSRSGKNIGIHTGDGLMVLDIDVQHKGDESILALLHEHGPLPDTFAVTTPSGGMHFYFETDKDIRNSVSKIAPGIDVRGHNGFVVAPGSYREPRTKDDGSSKPGGHYVATNALPPADCPKWLEALCLKDNRPLASARSGAVSAHQPLEDVPAGLRNDRLFKEACSLRGRGWTHEAILEALTARNKTFSEPLKQTEVIVITQQAARYAPNDTRLHDASKAMEKHVKATYRRPDEPTGQKSSDETPERVPEPFDVMASDRLYGLDLPPLKYCVEPLMAEGLYLLNGRPKGGKSWLAMEIATAVATGKPLWGEYSAHQGSVLYLALEDGYRRLKDRLKFFDNPKGIDFVIKDVELIDTGLFQQLQWWLDAQSNPQLIVIDILQQIMGESGNGENAYKFDYRMAKQLQSWAIGNRICLLIVHHTRKMVTDHDMDSVSGSQGLGGAADGVWFLKSPNNGKTGSLTMFSRDTDNGQYDLGREDKPCGRWTFVGEHDEQNDLPTDVRIVAELQAGGAATVAKIASALGSDRAHIKRTISRMHQEGKVERVKEKNAFVYSLSAPVKILPA